MSAQVFLLMPIVVQINSNQSLKAVHCAGSPFNFIVRAQIMEPLEIIQELKNALSHVKGKGQAEVEIESIEKFLEIIKKDIEPSNEQRRLEYQRVLAHYQAQNNSSLESFRSVIESGNNALNSIILINGGAAIALLSSLSTLSSKETNKVLVASLTLPLLLFGLGVLSSSVGYGARYFAQALYHEASNKVGHTFRWLSIAFSALAYALFGFGIYGAYKAFSVQFVL